MSSELPVNSTSLSSSAPHAGENGSAPDAHTASRATLPSPIETTPSPREVPSSPRDAFDTLGLAHPEIGQAPLLPPREPAGARLATFMGRHHTPLFVLCVLLLWLIVAAPPLWRNDAYRKGEVATRDILAPHAAMLLDRAETERRRDAAAAVVPPVYDPDASAQARALTQLRLITTVARRSSLPALAATALLQPQSSLSNPRSTSIRTASAKKVVRPIDRRARVLRRLLSERLEAPIPLPLALELAAIGANRWAIVERAAQMGVQAVYTGGQIRSDVAADIGAARGRIATAVAKARNDLPLSRNEIAAAASLARFVARTPNLVVNAQATEKARQSARREVRNVYLQIEANMPLVKASELITDERFEQLRDMSLVAPRFDWRLGLARLALCVAMVTLSASFLKYFTPRLLRRPTALWLAAAVPLLFIGAFRLMLWVPHADAATIPLAATAAMLLTVLLDARVGMLSGFVVAAFCTLMARADVGLLMAAALSAWTGTLGVASIASRGQLLRAGALLTVANGVLAAMLGVMRDAPGEEILSMVMWGAASGAISVVAMAGLAMSLERPFGITTHLRLLELLSPDETTLQRMQAEAPGTYTHAMMVGSLSEAAAKAIEGADPLLCRVGGIYHDIGKLRRPHCFVENQSGENIHDRLSPQLSALVILAHVKDGLELGRAIRLPQPVMDIIAQHHGTGLISYFYERARVAAEIATHASVSGDDVVEEGLFRYPGPRPQGKEAAIVMLADTIEASARSLPDLTPERLQTHIGAMIAQRLNEGELSDSDLTLRDLQTVESTFAHVLRGVLHQRISYPDPERELREASEGESERSSSAASVKSQPRNRRDTDRSSNAAAEENGTSHNANAEAAPRESGRRARRRARAEQSSAPGSVLSHNEAAPTNGHSNGSLPNGSASNGDAMYPGRKDLPSALTQSQRKSS